MNWNKQWFSKFCVFWVNFACLANLHASPIAFGSFPNNSTHSSASVAQAIANVPANVGVVYDVNGQTNDIQIWNFNTLLYTGSYNIATTLTRIRDGYYMPTESDDGGFFNFSANEMPNIPRMGNNYYMEFMVWPSMNFTNATYDPSVEPFSGMTFPGAMRLLIGLGGEVYFTGDHYGESGTQTNAYYVNPVTTAPRLNLTQANPSTMLLSWPTNFFVTYVLQQNTSPASTNWVSVTNTPGVANGQYQIALPISTAAAAFYRLQAP
jgi:hypothetical protein